MWDLVWSLAHRLAPPPPETISSAPRQEDTSHYLGLRVYRRSLVDQDLSNVDFILLGSQVERSQTGLGTDRETEFNTWMTRQM